MSQRQSGHAGEQAVRSTQPVPTTKTRRIHPKKTSKLPAKMRSTHPLWFLVTQYGEVFDQDGNFSNKLYKAELEKISLEEGP
jgi:hypothetical protein